MDAINVQQLSRVYRTTNGLFRRTSKDHTALDNVDLSVAQGELFGLLGPNGAGKTTLTKILTTILLPTSGRAEVLGLDVVRDAARLRPQIGIVFGGDRGLYLRLSGRDNIQYFADLYKVPSQVARQRVPELLELLGLQQRAEERVEGYSRGMRQRVHIARGLVHDPQVIFLDEPTIGLDPVAARELRQIVLRLKEAGKTIFLTSHYMYEIDALCDRVAVMSKGRILTVDTPSALKRLVADLEVIEIECLGISAGTISQIKAHRAVETVNVAVRDQVQVLQIQAPARAELIQDFLNMLNGARVQNVLTRQPTLEDAYVKLVGKDALEA